MEGRDRLSARKARIAKRDKALALIDASTFSRQIESLAITLTNLTEREGPKKFGYGYLSIDLGMILRQMTHCYDLLLFLNADDTRDWNPGYREGYSFVILPIIRTMIDGFYNITSLLDDPSRSKAFRVDGYRRFLEALDSDAAKYAGDSRWDAWIKRQRRMTELRMSEDGTTLADLANKKAFSWPLLGAYLAIEPKDSPHRKMLRELTHGFWKEYSNISHAGFSGLLHIFPYISRDRMLSPQRDIISDLADREITLHLGRAAGILLAVVTEIQARYRFECHNIGYRINEAWNALLVMPEVRALYEHRYMALMISASIRNEKTSCS